MRILEAHIGEAGYGQKIILNNVSIDLSKREIVALIGPNGAGKSTLIKALIGIVKVRSGKVLYNGNEITNKNPDVLVRRGISFVPQGNQVFGELMVRENLEMGGYTLNDTSEVRKRIEHVVELFPDLRDRMKVYAGKLSGGEKQQLAIGRALMLKPELLLLDEPSLGLSPKLVTQAFEKIKQINSEYETTFLIVEQKVHEILRIASRVYGLRMGQVAFQGTVDELGGGDNLKKIFLL